MVNYYYFCVKLNIMVKLIIFLLVSYGITNIMIFGSIFEKFRELIGVNSKRQRFFGKLFGCFMCLSFWVGVLISLLMYSPIDSNFLINDLTLFSFKIPKNIIILFFDACLSSSGVWLIHTIQERIET